VMQRGVDLTLAFKSPGGKLQTQPDNPAGPFGTRWITFRVAANEEYRLELRASDEFAMQGSYEITFHGSSPLSVSDEKRLAAGEKIVEGQRKQSLGGKEASLGIDLYEQARLIWRELKDQQEEADASHRIAIAYKSLRQWKTAESYYQEALKLRREIGDRQGEGYTLNDLAVLYRDWSPRPVSKDQDADLGTEQAFQSYQHAIEIFRSLGNVSGFASSYYGTGILYATRYQMVKALEFYKTALEKRREIGDLRGEARTLNAIGGANEVLGNNTEALEQYQKAMILWRCVEDSINLANTENNIGIIYDDWADWQKAIDHYSKSISVYEALGRQDPPTRRKEAITLTNLGGIHLTLGEFQQSNNFLKKALDIFGKIDNVTDKATTLGWLGYACYLQGDQQGALGFLEQARSLQEMSRDPKITETYTMMGMAKVALQEYQKAHEYYQKALAIQRDPDGGSRMGQGITLDKLGEVLSAMGDAKGAIESYSQAMKIWKQMGNRDGESLTFYNLARFERGRGNLIEADHHIQSAIKVVETLRTNVTGQHLRGAYFTTKVGFYELAADIKMQRNRGEPDRGYNGAALLAVEQARARNLMESLVEVRSELREGVDKQLAGREQELVRLHDSKWQLLMRLKSNQRVEAQTSAMENQVDSLASEIDQVRSEIRRRNPRYASLTQPQPLTLEEIQKQVLDEDTILLEFSLGEERSYLWAATKSSLASFELPRRSEIEGAAKELYELIKQQQIASEARYHQAAGRLSDMLLAGVSEQIAGRRLLIVADGALQYIPFSVLPIPAKPEFTPLILEHEIINLPSATTLAVIRRELGDRRPAEKQIALLADPVFDPQDERLKLARFKSTPGRQNQKTQKKATEDQNGNIRLASVEKNEGTSAASSLRESGVFGPDGVIPELPLSGQEARAIFKLVPASDGLMATGFQANKQTAQSDEMARYRVVHFATHGVLDDQRPERSGLLLSYVDERGRAQDGFLGLNSVYNLKLSADLAVLSACRTGLGKEVKGEGLVGLTRGFMYAGVPRVIASLWKVEDAATRDLMTLFYQKLFGDKMRPAAALRAAQVEMMKRKTRRAPFFWGAFVIQGEWK
jgi:CHAT domain-containing protein